jgi:Fe-S cluster assembly protein SufD
MTEVESKLNSSYSDIFRNSLNNDEPSWVRLLRENGFDRFEQVGFPTTDEEEWKYTNVAPIAKIPFEIGSNDSLDKSLLESYFYKETRQSQLVFVNGLYEKELSSIKALPESVVVGDIKDLLKNGQAGLVRDYLARIADYNKDSFTALNTALFSGGAFLFIPKNVEISIPVHLLFLSTSKGRPIISSPRLLIVSERNSSATIIESYASIDNGSTYFTNAVVEIFVGENARLMHYKVQREDEKAFHIANTTVDMERNSSYNSTAINVGAALSRHNIGIVLDHEGSECWIDGLYMVGDGQHTDTHSLIDHISPHCKSHQLYKGVLTEKSRAVFNGKVFVHKEAQKTDAFQTNKNLLLSNEARVDTKPQLEIFADDVKCSHGATVGQLEEEELFYLISRGLREETARNLLTYGFAEEIIEKIKLNSIKDELNDLILNRLHANF